jgi:two-component system phosphate regulon sensor histidine kinase PhoR
MTTRRAPSKIIPRAFPGITPDEVQKLISHSKVHSYQTGTVLCREDKVETTFYMILEGEVEVTKNINQSEERLLKTLRPGDFFGEMGLIHNAPRAATVTAKTNLVALELEKEAFDDVLNHSASISRAMVREISNRLRENDEMAVEDLRLRARELAQAYQKLAEEEVARREFLTNVAHELRTPLMAASGYLEILQSGMLNKDHMNHAVDTVARNVQKIATLVNDIFFLQELELVLPDFQPVEMGEIASNVLEQYKAQAVKRGVHLSLTEDHNLPPVSGDPKSLEHALMALVDNAIKFSPRGGDVEIRLRRGDERVLVTVEDHGIGISPNTQPRIFDRFYHLEKHEGDLFDGIGLGLAITRQVIQQHKGTLEVESELNKGSTFTMSLPVWQAAG